MANDNSDDFEFVVKKNVRSKTLTEEEVLEGLKKFAKQKNFEYFPSREYEAFRKKENHSKKSGYVSSETLCRRFGTWKKVLEKVGIKGGWERGTDPMIPFTYLEKLWRQLGRMPTQKEFDNILKQENTGSSLSQFARYHGNYLSGCRKFADWKSNKISKEQLLEPQKTNKREPISGRTRIMVLDRDGHKCVKCGRTPKDRVKLHLDHIKPVSKGGKSTPENLQTLCDICNLGKGDYFKPNK